MSQQLFFKPCFINKTDRDMQNLASARLAGIFLSSLLRLEAVWGCCLLQANMLAPRMRNQVRCFSIWFLLPQRLKSWKQSPIQGGPRRREVQICRPASTGLPSVSAKLVRCKLRSCRHRWFLWPVLFRFEAHQFCFSNGKLSCQIDNNWF